MTAPIFTWPLPGHYEVSSGFNDVRLYGPHNAIDVPAPSGTPYRAIAPGRVAFAGGFGSCGLTVQIDHVNRWRSHVCHLGTLQASAGQQVPAGAIIGYVGSTGDSTGPHAHINLFAPTALPGSRYVAWVNKWAVDPLLYLTKEDDMKPPLRLVRGPSRTEPEWATDGIGKIGIGTQVRLDYVNLGLAEDHTYPVSQEFIDSLIDVHKPPR